jgi:hypothetical protein
VWLNHFETKKIKVKGEGKVITDIYSGEKIEGIANQGGGGSFGSMQKSIPGVSFQIKIKPHSFLAFKF